MRITRRGLFELALAFVATTPLRSPRAFLPVDAGDEVLVAEIVDDESHVVVHTSGTRLERFMKSRGIKPAHLARESGYSRQHLLRIRMGKMEPTRRCIVHITSAARRLAHEPITAANLFDLAPADALVLGRWQRIAASRLLED